MPVLFAVSLFVSATLLFLVQPMVGKMVLPRLGGTPAVWNTCMVFFQAMLLAGYAYAHASTRLLGARRQAVLHCVLLLLPLAVLPIGVAEHWAPPPGANPIPAALGLLLVAVGLPFFMLSTTAPLLQRWFAGTGHPSARDPYFLYAASNLGSMLSLLAYPALLEPSLELKAQSWYWALGYGVFVALNVACAMALWRSPTQGSLPLVADEQVTADGEAVKRPTVLGRLHWVALAFVPSTLMLGVTTYLSTDIAPFPLIWVVPLGLYLLSFILVFSRLPAVIHTLFVLLLPVLVLLQFFMMYANIKSQPWVIAVLHLLTLFVAAMVCHGELARRRPAPQYLTEFYLWMSLGGVLGGAFNALVAPLVFTNVTEYPLAMVLACLLLPPLGDTDGEGLAARAYSWFVRRFLNGEPGEGVLTLLRPCVLDWVLPLVLGVFTVGLLLALSTDRAEAWLDKLHDWLVEWQQRNGRSANVPEWWRLQGALQYGIPVLICYAFVTRPVRFGLGLGAVLVAAMLYTYHDEKDKVIHRERSFFGVLTVERIKRDSEDGPHNRLIHGRIMHGLQSIDDNGRPIRDGEPLSYYHREGPLGQVFEMLEKTKDKRPVAVIGLGTGTTACYAEPGREFTYYEIDPAVLRIARNTNYFTYLDDAEKRGAPVNVVMGDARLSLQDHAANGHYRLIVVDAFSSDAIPYHLITREALKLYFDKLAPDGILAFHISNRYLDLRPVLANLAKDAGLTAIIQQDSESGGGRSASTWVMLARNDKAFGSLADDIGRQWTRLEQEDKDGSWAKVGVWTDDFSNVLGILMW